jgi:hypothetical protein
MTTLHHDWPAATPAALVADLGRQAAWAHDRLGQWGPWRADVAVFWLEDRGLLPPAQAEGQPLALRAVATREAIWLWAPWCWPGGWTGQQVRDLLGHELTHAWWLQRAQHPDAAAALAEVSTWLREGLAVALGLETAPSRSALAALPLPHWTRLALAGPADLAADPAAVYGVAAHVASHAVHTLGRRGLHALARQLGQGMVLEEVLLQQGLGTELALIAAARKAAQ